MRAFLVMLAVVAVAGCGGRSQDQAAAEPVVCGGQQALACQSDEYCAFPQTGFCGVAGQTGVCMPRPQVCTMAFNPICGCDGQTYPTSCAAATAGVSVASVGECWQ
jgi:Kazal-type serine protease inhibitor domain